MEPITTIKTIYETARTIQKIYTVSKEMKTVAESEGADKIIATKDLANNAVQISQESKGEKEKSLSKEFSSYYKENDNPLLSKSDFIDKLEATHSEVGLISDTVKFVDRYSSDEISKDMQNKEDIFVDRLPSREGIGAGMKLSGENSNLSQNKFAKEIVEQNPSDSNDVTDIKQKQETESLTKQEKQEIKDKTGWPDEIVDAIRTKEESQVYMDAGLIEGEINGKPALLQPKIDGKACNEPKWPDWNNKDLAEEGYPPRDKKGYPYELHHIGQNPNSPLAELTYEQHHSDGNFKILHTFDESSIDRVQFNKERKEYWSERSKSL